MKKRLDQLTFVAIVVVIAFCVFSCNGESDREKKVRESKEALQRTLDSIDRDANIKLRNINDTINSLNAGATIKQLRNEKK